MIFLTKASYKHAFNNIGDIQLNAVEHFPELIENAILTHSEEITHGSDYATGIYTFFATAKSYYVHPVKLKVKEYRYSGQELPQNIKNYFKNSPQNYSASYDAVVLEVEEIEKSSSGSAKDMNQKDSFLNPDELSNISVVDLLNLVKGRSEKYIPNTRDGSVCLFIRDDAYIVPIKYKHDGRMRASAPTIKKTAIIRRLFCIVYRRV